MLRIRRAALVTATALVVSLFSALVATGVEGATVLRMSLADLAARCDLALEARVTSCSASIDSAGRIGTDYALTVERTFAGAPLAQRTIRLPGGVLSDGRGMVIPGMPAPVVGETLILFLSAENTRSERIPIGLAQGRLRVVIATDGTRSIATDVAGLDFVDTNGQVLPQPLQSASTLPYAATVDRIVAECARRADTRALHPAPARPAGAGR